jgi:DNA adenine methylase
MDAIMNEMPQTTAVSSDMPIKALAPWFGSKRTLGPVIVAELGKHTGFWDVFCGGLSILFAKPRCTIEVVNDLHRDLFNLAKVLQDRRLKRELQSRAMRTLFHESFLVEVRERMIAHPAVDAVPNVDRAMDYLVLSWFGRNGQAGLANTERNARACIRYTPFGGQPGRRWVSVTQSIGAWARRLSGVTMLNRDGFELLERICDQSGTAIYCDPPYIKKSDRYVHDFEPEDHKRLAAILSRFKSARVVVSYYDHPDLAGLYPGWTVVKQTMAKATSHVAKRGENNSVAYEVLLINGPSHTQISMPLLAQENANA